MWSPNFHGGSGRRRRARATRHSRLGTPRSTPRRIPRRRRTCHQVAVRFPRHRAAFHLCSGETTRAQPEISPDPQGVARFVLLHAGSADPSGVASMGRVLPFLRCVAGGTYPVPRAAGLSCVWGGRLAKFGRGSPSRRGAYGDPRPLRSVLDVTPPISLRRLSTPQVGAAEAHGRDRTLGRLLA